MGLPIWIPEGKTEEQEITLSGERKTFYANPWKWYTVEVFNKGPDEAYVTTNDTPDYSATKLDDRESHTFGTDKKPTILELRIRVDTGKTATVKISTMR